MRAFVLAAGFGTRLKPVTDHIPKALVPACGKPLLERALSFCASSGISEIGVNTHYLHGKIEEYRDRSAIPFTLFHEDGVIRGTGGGIYYARDFLAGDELFFVCNADIVCRFDLAGCISRFLTDGWTACLIAVPPADAGSILYEPGNSRFIGVPREGERPTGARAADFIGAALYRREFLDLLLPDDFSVVPVWERIARQYRNVGVQVVDNCYWRDAGTARKLAAIHFDAIDGTSDLDLPGHLRIDRKEKRCVHRELSPEAVGRLGPYAWVELPELPAGLRIERSVVTAGAVVGAGPVLDHCLVTPFGEVRFG